MAYCQMALLAKFLLHMKSSLHFFHLLHIAQELETLMFMSTADCNRSGHVATDTINTFTARKGAGAGSGQLRENASYFIPLFALTRSGRLVVV